ncbi:MAG: hypothetical protein RR415_12680 [Ruthenibacterium sp.]
MQVKIKKLNFREAETMTNILKKYSCEAVIEQDENNRVDAKSLLGVIAMTYFAAPALLVINELDPQLYGELNRELMPFYSR